MQRPALPRRRAPVRICGWLAGEEAGRASLADAPAYRADPPAPAAAVLSGCAREGALSVYDPIADLYDPWSRSVVEDVEFYVEEALRAGGRVLELGVGTGRIAVPTAAAGVEVVGVDSSTGMLALAARRAAAAGVALDLRLGDFRDPPVAPPLALVTIPFRSLLHMLDDRDRRAVFAAAARLLALGGRLVFDVFAPSAEDVAETHGRWLEREPGIFERADWDEPRGRLTLRVRGLGAESALELAWLPVERWASLLEAEGFVVEGLYGWFDRTPWDGHEDSIWVCRRGVPAGGLNGP